MTMSKKMDKQCVMLAAGLSSRMGKWKMMMPWGEGTILDSALPAPWRSAIGWCW
jgi:molybdenum cofactor cytidylyltransferase